MHNDDTDLYIASVNMLQTSPQGGRNNSVYMPSCPFHTEKKPANFDGNFHNPLIDSLTWSEGKLIFFFFFVSEAKKIKCFVLIEIKPF